MWDDEQEEGQAEELFSPDQYEFDEDSHANDDDDDDSFFLDDSSFSSTGRVLRSPVSSIAISAREQEERDSNIIYIYPEEDFEGGMRRLSVDSATDYLTRERYESSSQSSDQWFPFTDVIDW